jgi:hypothetical protein
LSEVFFGSFLFTKKNILVSLPCADESRYFWPIANRETGMDEGTATVIASVIAAIASIAVAWITSRPRQPSPPAPPTQDNPSPISGSGADWSLRAAASPPPTMATWPVPAAIGNSHLIAKGFLYFLYFLTGVLLIICGAENDINQQEANFAAGFAILFGVAAWFIRKRIKAMPRA